MADEATAAALLARKRKVRAGHRASITRFINQATTAMGADEVDTDQLSLIKQMLVEKVETLRVLDGEMADIVPENELEAEIQGADEYNERVYGVLTKLKKALGPSTTLSSAALASPAPPPSVELPTPPDPPTTEPRTIPTESHAAVVTTTPTTDRVKLPKISLPQFRGNLMKWTAFWDSFTSAVHTNDQLSEIDKFNYLRVTAGG